MSKILFVGFDSAWTAKNRGAIAGAVQLGCDHIDSLGIPTAVDYHEAQTIIERWQEQHAPDTTLILLDQPTIVPNHYGQRPVENLVGSVVSRRYGGVQPANRGKGEMFGSGAPVWSFLEHFGGVDLPTSIRSGSFVIETYPVLTLISLGWTRPDARPCGRLPRYNPANRKRFLSDDWEFLCQAVAGALAAYRLEALSKWLLEVQSTPRKPFQDGLDACICLLVALHMGAGRPCLVTGDDVTGYMLVPHSPELAEEIETRCIRTGRAPTDWIRSYTFSP